MPSDADSTTSTLFMDRSGTTVQRSVGGDASDPGSPLGPRVGRFRLLRKIGEGGMGEVYAAYDESLDRLVAVKLLRAAFGSNTEARVRLQREAQALARLSHPNVVTVYEVGELEGRIFVAMEHVDGMVLRDWQAPPERTLAERLAAYRQSGRGIQAAHAVGIIHRDFKAMNAIMGRDGRVRVLDFGLAFCAEESVAEGEHATSSLLRSRLSFAGARIGTPAYMSPEQLLGRPANERSDQFSFCVALFEALYGYHPFAVPGNDDLVGAVLSGRVLPPPQKTGVPESVHRALLRGLSIEPELRWPDMATLLDALGPDPELNPSAERKHRRAFSITYFLANMGILARAFLIGGDAPPHSPPQMLFIALSMFVLVCGAMLVFRRSLMQNQFHRYMMQLTLASLVIMSISRGLGVLHGDSSEAIIVRDLVAIAAISAAVPLILPEPPPLVALPMVTSVLGAALFSTDLRLGLRGETAVFSVVVLSALLAWERVAQMNQIPLVAKLLSETTESYAMQRDAGASHASDARRR